MFLKQIFAWDNVKFILTRILSGRTSGISLPRFVCVLLAMEINNFCLKIFLAILKDDNRKLSVVHGSLIIGKKKIC